MQSSALQMRTNNHCGRALYAKTLRNIAIAGYDGARLGAVCKGIDFLGIQTVLKEKSIQNLEAQSGKSH